MCLLCPNVFISMLRCWLKLFGILSVLPSPTATSRREKKYSLPQLHVKFVLASEMLVMKNGHHGDRKFVICHLNNQLQLHYNLRQVTKLWLTMLIGITGLHAQLLFVLKISFSIFSCLYLNDNNDNVLTERCNLRFLQSPCCFISLTETHI